MTKIPASDIPVDEPSMKWFRQAASQKPDLFDPEYSVDDEETLGIGESDHHDPGPQTAVHGIFPRSPRVRHGQVCAEPAGGDGRVRLSHLC